ncbi:uncharacterized protein cd34 [Spinachia spinachia]
MGVERAEREREARGVEPYKEQQNTRQASFRLIVPLTKTSQETRASPWAPTRPLNITQHTLYSHSVPPARMAASMCGTSGPRMAAAVLLCALMLSNEVMCQDVPATDANPTTAATPAPSLDSEGVGANTSDTAEGNSSASTSPSNQFNANTQPDDEDASTVTRSAVVTRRANVMCVAKEEIPENSNIKRFALTTDDCEATKRIIQENPESWCNMESCNLKIFQDGNWAHVTSDDANMDLVEAFMSQHLNAKLDENKTDTSTSSGSSVFWGVLVSGLLAALAITLGYLKCQRRTDTKGVRLAEESYAVEQDNQGNTLVSVAPLNPSPETPEKPSVNGEAPEADKTQAPPPPTNGHSTAKTADTEM